MLHRGLETILYDIGGQYDALRNVRQTRFAKELARPTGVSSIPSR